MLIIIYQDINFQNHETEIEIEVPEGKKAVWEDGQIKFVDIEHWKNIKTFEDAYKYCSKVKGLVTDLLYLYNRYLSIGYSG